MVPPEHSLLNGVIINKLAEIFRLHGAVEMEPTLLLPVTKAEDQEKAIFLDKYGDAVMLPDHGLLPMARLAERRAQERIKRYHIGDVYKPRSVTATLLPHVILIDAQPCLWPSAYIQISRLRYHHQGHE
jgi:translation initiation factor 2-alpha kinase 4